MTCATYRYSFDRVPTAKVEGIFLLAVVAAEGLFGAARVRLEATHLLNRQRGICVVRSRGPAGHAVNRIFVSLIGRMFGPDSFSVEHPDTEDRRATGSASMGATARSVA